MNPVKAKMAVHPEEYRWSSYKTIIGMQDDQITSSYRTLAYFQNHNVTRYKEFVEDVGHKVYGSRTGIRKKMGEDEIMATVVKRFAIQGIEGYNVDIETKMLDGQPMISIMGWVMVVVKEAGDRIQSVIDEMDM